MVSLFLVCFSSLLEWTWNHAGGKWKSMLSLLLLTWLFAISFCVGINFPSLNAHDINWLLLSTFWYFHSDVWQCLFCFLVACIRQFYWLNNFFRLKFVATPKWRKIQVQRKEIILFLTSALKSWKFSCTRKSFFSRLRPLIFNKINKM